VGYTVLIVKNAVLLVISALYQENVKQLAVVLLVLITEIVLLMIVNNVSKARASLEAVEPLACMVWIALVKVTVPHAQALVEPLVFVQHAVVQCA